MTTLLKEEIQKLISVQIIDSRIHELNREKNVVIPEQVRLLTAAFQCKKDEFAACGENLKSAQLRKKDRELDLAAKEENLRKAQGQLYQLKTNKEYHAKLSEIGALKTDISVAEEELLKTMDDVEKEMSLLEAAKQALSGEEKRYKDAEKELSDAIAAKAAEIDGLTHKRKQYIGDIKPELLNSYENLLRTRDGLAIAPVKGASCGACHMAVSHQKINEIKMYGGLVFCETCVRILYIPEDYSL